MTFFFGNPGSIPGVSWKCGNLACRVHHRLFSAVAAHCPRGRLVRVRFPAKSNFPPDRLTFRLARRRSTRNQVTVAQGGQGASPTPQAGAGLTIGLTPCPTWAAHSMLGGSKGAHTQHKTDTRQSWWYEWFGAPIDALGAASPPPMFGCFKWGMAQQPEPHTRVASGCAQWPWDFWSNSPAPCGCAQWWRARWWPTHYMRGHAFCLTPILQGRRFFLET